MADRVDLSLIIPVLDESQRLDRALADLFARDDINSGCEVIVSDGGSTDSTLEIAARYPCRILQTQRGRSAQMNAGAAAARGQTLLFLHADSSLPEAMPLASLLGSDWGFFKLRLSGQRPIYRVIEGAINLRTSLTRVAGGDQGLFFSRPFFDSIGGFAAIPLMEDVAISKRARKLSQPLIIEQRMLSSSRRWQQQGVIRTIVLMWALRLAYWIGVKPERLHRIYYPQGG